MLQKFSFKSLFDQFHLWKRKVEGKLWGIEGDKTFFLSKDSKIFLINSPLHRLWVFFFHGLDEITKVKIAHSSIYLKSTPSIHQMSFES